MEPLVSILIPAYNAEQWIKDTIRSALDQTWERKEIIMVDDGSSDGTYSIAGGFGSKILKVVRQDNAGGPAARNKALSLAQGDFIQWLDHDDLLAPDKIALQIRAIEYGEDRRILLSSASGTFYYRHRKARFIANMLWQDLTPLEYLINKFEKNIWLQSGAWLVSREISEKAGPWWELRSPDDDGEYFCRIVMSSMKIKFVSNAKSYWRIGNYRSMSEKKSDEALDALFASTCRCIEHLRSLDDSERSRKACVQFIQDRLINFYPEKTEIVKKSFDLARELGGDLIPPPLKWKYAGIKKIFGYAAAKDISLRMPRIKASIINKYDRIMHRVGF